MTHSDPDSERAASACQKRGGIAHNPGAQEASECS
jgi:hypothetical protein